MTHNFKKKMKLTTNRTLLGESHQSGFCNFVRNRVCRKSGKKPHAKTRRRKVNELTIFAPSRLCVRNSTLRSVFVRGSILNTFYRIQNQPDLASKARLSLLAAAQLPDLSCEYKFWFSLARQLSPPFQSPRT